MQDTLALIGGTHLVAMSVAEGGPLGHDFRKRHDSHDSGLIYNDST
jgi:hypothetical protein